MLNTLCMFLLIISMDLFIDIIYKKCILADI